MEKKRGRRSVRKFLRLILWVFIVQLLLINISAAFYAYRLTHVYADNRERQPLSRTNALMRTWRLFTGPRYQKSVVSASPVFAYDTVMLKTSKGIYLDAWFAPADSSAKGTVILFHGITTNKASLLAEASDFHYQGFHVMLVDFRAHGNSGGKTMAMGIRESEDVKLAYDYIASRGEANIFLYGSSMGAVAVMKAAAEGEIKPAGIIIEMPFASLQSHLQARARIEGFSGWVEKPFSFLVAGWMSMERGYNGYKHRSTSYAERISCPVLMQWGRRDRIVLEKETMKIYNALATKNKKLVVYESAGHESLLQKETSKWRSAVSAFLEGRKE